jgi:hypothetical protein
LVVAGGAVVATPFCAGGSGDLRPDAGWSGGSNQRQSVDNGGDGSDCRRTGHFERTELDLHVLRKALHEMNASVVPMWIEFGEAHCLNVTVSKRLDTFASSHCYRFELFLEESDEVAVCEVREETISRLRPVNAGELRTIPVRLVLSAACQERMDVV